MPPVSPIDLLDCIKTMINEETGGFKGSKEALQLTNLMNEFSRNFVCKCIFVFILKESSLDLLNIFIESGGWGLLYYWLKAAVETDNIMLIQDLLMIYHTVPVTFEQLKTNEAPKLIKILSKKHTSQDVKSIACKLVNKWLKTVLQEASQCCEMKSDVKILNVENTLDNVKSEPEEYLSNSISRIDSKALSETKSDGFKSEFEKTKSKNKNSEVIERTSDQTKEEKNVLCIENKYNTVKCKNKSKLKKYKIHDESDKSDNTKKKRCRLKNKNGNLFVKTTEEINNKVSKIKSKNKHTKVIESTSDQTKEKKNVLCIRSKDYPDKCNNKSKLKKRKIYDESDDTIKKKCRSKDKNGNLFVRIIEEINNKESDEDKPTENFTKEEPKPLPLPTPKPKLPNSKMILKKTNLSIDTKKNKLVGEKKPTSKCQSAGSEILFPSSSFKSEVQSKILTKNLTMIEDNLKDIKGKDLISLSKAGQKRLLPLSNSPAEKKLKNTFIGFLKSPNLQESNMFMNNWLNVLHLSRTFKKPIPKQEKKDQDPSSSPSANPVLTPYSSVKIEQPLPLRPLVYAPSTVATDTRAALSLSQDKLLSIAEPNVPPSIKNTAVSYVKPEHVKTMVEKPTQEFFQDTFLDPTTKSIRTGDVEGKTDNKNCCIETTKSNGNDNKHSTKSVLVYVRNTIKKSVTWKDDLVQIFVFESDKTERVNLTKKFQYMKKYERYVERHNFLNAKKLNFVDNMQPRTNWRSLDFNLLVEVPDTRGREQTEPGVGSQEKKKQTLQEQSFLPVFHSTRNMIPGSQSPEELHQIEKVPFSEPLNIPFEDISVNPERKFSYVISSWPKPKGYQPSDTELLNKISMLEPTPTPMVLKQSQFSECGYDQINWAMAPDNMITMSSSPNSKDIPQPDNALSDALGQSDFPTISSHAPSTESSAHPK